MKIVKHYHLDGHLQRSEVRHDGVNYVRIARWVKSCGTLQPIEQGIVPTWRMITDPQGEVTRFTKPEVEELERCFVATLIRLCVDSGAIKPTYRILAEGDILQIGDEFQAEKNVWRHTKCAGLVVEQFDLTYRRAVSSRSPDAAE